MLKFFQRISLIVNFKTVVVTALAVLSTYLCERFGFTAELPLTLVTIAVVFPIVFSIGGAYMRRESVLDDYGVIKAHGRAINFAARDWLENPSEEVLGRARERLGNLMYACRNVVTEPVKAMAENEEESYVEFSKLSRFIRDDLRGNGLASGEVSRCNQYLSKMMSAFEHIKHIYQYRTPKTLRTFSDFFIVALPIVYGPHFASLAGDSTGGIYYVMLCF